MTEFYEQTIWDKAHAAGRREAWEKMRRSCAFHKSDLCLSMAAESCAYDTCPLLKESDTDE